MAVVLEHTVKIILNDLNTFCLKLVGIAVFVIFIFAIIYIKHKGEPHLCCTLVD